MHRLAPLNLSLPQITPLLLNASVKSFFSFRPVYSGKSRKLNKQKMCLSSWRHQPDGFIRKYLFSAIFIPPQTANCYDGSHGAAAILYKNLFGLFPRLTGQRFFFPDETFSPFNEKPPKQSHCEHCGTKSRVLIDLCEDIWAWTSVPDCRCLNPVSSCEGSERLEEIVKSWFGCWIRKVWLVSLLSFVEVFLTSD